MGYLIGCYFGWFLSLLGVTVKLFDEVPCYVTAVVNVHLFLGSLSISFV